MKNFVVTGGLGFLGQYLVSDILKSYPDAQITIIARSSRKIFLTNLENHDRVTVHTGCDLLKPESVDQFFSSADVVFHAAAMVSFQKKDRQELINQNKNGTMNVLHLCKKYKVSKLVYISSTAAIGYNNSLETPADETLVFDFSKAEKYPYSFSKYLAEREVLEAAKNGLPVVITNPSSIYGAGDKKIVPLLDSVKNEKLPGMMPGGLACVDVRDVASGVLAAYEHGVCGERYILTGGNYSHIELISTIARLMNVSPPKKILSFKFGKLMSPCISFLESVPFINLKITSEIFEMGFKFRYFSTAKAELQLKWKPQFSLEDTFNDILTKQKNNKGS